MSTDKMMDFVFGKMTEKEALIFIEELKSSTKKIAKGAFSGRPPLPVHIGNARTRWNKWVSK